MPAIYPHPETQRVESEIQKIDKVYADGWLLYDAAERISQSVAAVGNLLRTLRNNLGDPCIAAQLKQNADDIKLIMYLERIEETLQPCGDILTKCEDTVRDVRNGLVQINYKKTVPQPVDNGFVQTNLADHDANREETP